MGTNPDDESRGPRPWFRFLHPALVVAAMATGLVTGISSMAVAASAATSARLTALARSEPPYMATAVHHPQSHTSIQWWVPFLIVLAALVVVLVVVRVVMVRRGH